jgi:hypothetical protein
MYCTCQLNPWTGFHQPSDGSGLAVICGVGVLDVQAVKTITTNNGDKILILNRGLDAPGISIK